MFIYDSGNSEGGSMHPVDEYMATQALKHGRWVRGASHGVLTLDIMLDARKVISKRFSCALLLLLRWGICASTCDRECSCRTRITINHLERQMPWNL